MNFNRLRVGLLWNKDLIKEKHFKFKQNVTIGGSSKADFCLQVDANKSDIKSEILFKSNKKGCHELLLRKEYGGTINCNGKKIKLKGCELDSILLDSEDFGIITVGNLVLFFQYVKQNPWTALTQLPRLDVPLLASNSFSATTHIGFLLLALFLWTYSATDVKRQSHLFRAFNVDVLLLEEKEEEPIEEDLANDDDPSKRAEDEEGKFGDPDIDIAIESKVPRNEAPLVKKIDPKTVGLVDMLSTNNLGGSGAIANILSKNIEGIGNKMAIAMEGAGTEFVMGHGSAGMGFKGTGTGGGGTGGYGRIHGLGKIDVGGSGRGVRARLGRKKAKKVGKIRIGSGRSTGFCKKGDISRAVRRRAGSIRACYERKLMIKASLRGKLTARWTIGVSGRVSSARVVSSTLSDSAVTACVLRVIRRITFTKPEGGQCIVQWPFVFNPGS